MSDLTQVIPSFTITVFTYYSPIVDIVLIAAASIYGLMTQLIEGFKKQWMFVVPVNDAFDVTNCFAANGVKRDTMNALFFRMERKERERRVKKEETLHRWMLRSTASAWSAKLSRESLEFELATRINLYLLIERAVFKEKLRERISGRRMIYATVRESKMRSPSPRYGVAPLWPILERNRAKCDRKSSRAAMRTLSDGTPVKSYRELYPGPSGRVHLLLSRINPPIWQKFK